MIKSSPYIAKTPDAQGYVNYSDEENETWSFLYQRQIEIIQNRACDDYFAGLETLKLNPNLVPQLPDVNKALYAATGWQVAAVPALIPFGTFFKLLSQKQFPAATFIRRKAEIDYLQEPDIFHEIFGHCPLLTNPVFAEFNHRYGQLGLSASNQERVYLARLYWFSVEFGLLNTAQGNRIYGAGILSSKGESIYALEDSTPERRPFDLMTALRTPYRIDIFQTIYYVIQSFNDLFDVMNENLMPKIREAIALGDFAPTFPPKIKAPIDRHDC